MKLFSKIATVLAGFSLALGVGVAATSLGKGFQKANAAVNPNNTSWEEVTALTGLNTTDFFTIATNNGSSYLNGSTNSNGHFEVTAYGVNNPANTSAAGVVQFESVNTNVYKIKLVSNGKYLTSKDAKSGSAQVAASDSDGWLFSYDSGFDAIYQKGYSSKYASLRSYNNATFRTYQAGSATTPSSSGATLKIYKYVVNDDVLNSITLSGSMGTQHTSMPWDPTGLVVTANYQTQGALNVTSLATFEYDPATPSLGDTSVEVTASYGGKSATKSFSVTVEETPVYTLVNDATKLTPGTTFYLVGSAGSPVTYRIAKGVNGNHIKMNVVTSSTTISNGVNAGSTLITNEGTEYTLEGRSGNWQITDGTNYLAFTGTSNGNDTFAAANKDTANAKFTITNSGAVISIASNAQSERELRYNTSQGDLRNYALGGQNPLYMFAHIAPESTDFGELDHISLTSAPTTTYYHVGQQFDKTGLMVTAFDGANEDTAHSKNVTDDCTLSFVHGATFGNGDVGNLVVTASYSGKSVQFTLHIYNTANYRKLTSFSGDMSGQYLLVDNDTEGVVAFKSYTSAIDGTLYANASPVTDDSGLIGTGKELEVTLTKTSGGYSIQLVNGKYLNGAGTDNGISVSEDPVDLSIEYTSGHFNIKTSSDKYFTFSTLANQKRFRFIAADNASENVQLYKLEDTVDATAVTFAQMILDDITCNNGVTPPSTGDWEALADIYNDGSSVSAEGKVLLKNTLADASIVVDGSTSDLDIVKAALAKYDYIVGKYGKATYSDFIDRDPAPISPSNNVFITINNSNTLMLIIVVSSIVVVSSFAFFYIIKRRKHN